MKRNISQLYFLAKYTGLIKTPLFHFTQSSSGKNLADIGKVVLDKPDFDSKIQSLEQTQPFFDRLIFFDPDVMASLPGPLEVFDPVVETGKDMLVLLHNSLGIPWWGVISLTCFIVRLTIMPLIYVQLQRTNRLTAVMPVLMQTKKLVDQSKLPKYKKMPVFLHTCFQIISQLSINVHSIRKQKLKVLRLFIYNLFNFPLIITIVWSIRRLLVEESVKNTSFLWLPSLSGIDPYFIIPFLTVGCYYWNFQRFITPENKHTFFSKLRGLGQILVILWLPILCNWPSAIAWYMLSNAIFSVIQTTFLINPKFLRIVEPKMLIYQFMLRIVEYDKTQSETLIDSIKNGEESLMDKAIKEEVLVQQTEQMLKQLMAEQYEQNKTEQQPIHTDEHKF